MRQTGQVNCMGNFDVLLTVHLSTILVTDQLNSQNSCFIISLLYSSTCFEHYVLIIRMSKLYYTANGIITPVGGRPQSTINNHLSLTFLLYVSTSIQRQQIMSKMCVCRVDTILLIVITKNILKINQSIYYNSKQ